MWVELENLSSQNFCVLTSHERVDLVRVWMASYNIERADADGAGRSKNGKSFQRSIVQRLPLIRKGPSRLNKTLSGAGEDCFRGLYEVSLALVGVASPA